MKEAKAFAPANISCVFSLYEAEKSEQKGSLGMGFTLDKGVVARAEKGNIGISVNGNKIRFRTVEQVIKELTDERIQVKIESDLPFGCGFGLSGASALATAYAVNELMGLEKSKRELAMIAHVSEVENSTGRGDVGGQFNGGFMIKTIKEKPLAVQKLNIKQKDIFFKVYGEIETKEVISDEEEIRRINKAGKKALKMIKNLEKPTFEQVTEISKRFAAESGLLADERVKHDIERIERMGGKASMIMLGNAVYSNLPLPGYSKARISEQGARLL